MKTIPLHNRDGEVIAEAIVDDDMVPFLRPWFWRLSSNGYAIRDTSRTVGKTQVSMHRVVAALAHGDPLEVDHLNHDRLDNQRHNLRLATRAQNNQNQPARGRYRGVTRLPSGRWCARACVNRQQHHIGVFDSELEAAQAAERFRAEHMPFSLEARIA